MAALVGSSHGGRLRGVAASFALVLAGFVGACGTNEGPVVGYQTNSSGSDSSGSSRPGSSCAQPNTNCPCDYEDEARECGSVVEKFDDYVTCSRGTRTCQDGRWSGCTGDRTTIQPRNFSGPTGKSFALGQPGPCSSDFDVCDPYCYATEDTPGGFAAGNGFSNATTGLTLYGTVTPLCDSLTLTPSASSLSLSGSSMSTLSAAPITFSISVSPAHCLPAPFATTWTVDRFDRATITGGNNTDGSLSVVVPIAGSLRVTAYAAGKSVSTIIAVKVNVLEGPTASLAADPNKNASAAQIAAFGSLFAPLPGATASTATWLYPYADTFFPLSLPAPVAQYRYALSAMDSATAASAVKLSLRYPANATPATATFNYSLIVEENNSVACKANAANCNFLDPQIAIPQAAWQAFERTARGQPADLIVQRLRRQSAGGHLLEQEARQPIEFVDGQLKGSVYYQSYTSPLAGNTGAILAINPGATAPTVKVKPPGTCSVCHSINLDGTRLVTNGGMSGGSYSYGISARYDTTTSGPAPTVLNTYTDNRFTFGGPWMDGSYYMSHGGGGFPEWHAPTGASLLYRVDNSTTSVPVTGWPNNVQAGYPRFSPQGKKVAFTFRSGTSLPCSTTAVSPCTGSPKVLPAAAASTRLAVMDFTCASPPCNANSTGWAVSNARDVTPGVTDRIAWPNFSPDEKSVIYQRQIRSSKAILSWTPSDVGTVAGALAEIWISNVPSNGSTTATPTRLDALNGLGSAGFSYLPQQARTIVNDANPLYVFRMDRHELSQTVTSGMAGPMLVLTGVPTGAWDFRVAITVGGARGTARFRFSTNAGSSWSSDALTAASVSVGNGMMASFPTGTYNVDSTYRSQIGAVGVRGTPTAGPWDVRIKIDAVGARGTATFRFSTDGGSSYNPTPLTTAASVTLGTTGLVATFSNVTFAATTWVFGATVSHYHQDGARFPLIQSDSCSNNGNLASMKDTQTNYYPVFAPQEVGGKSWVLFTSRRMYGNVATENPWDPQPNAGCSSGKTPTKKLWLAAVEPDWIPGTDPSHPAFYLPGQETAAGNCDASWVDSACTAVDGACETDDDCCGASEATAQCRVISTLTVPPSKACRSRSLCAADSQSCTTTADCCTGLSCPTGGGLCFSAPPLLFEAQTFTRDYEAICPDGTFPTWRFFEWQSAIAADTQIELYVQTRLRTSDPWQPTAPQLIGVADQTSGPSQWFRGGATNSQVLSAANVKNGDYLRVTMIFSPSAAGTAAPTLLRWRQIYDCLPAE